MNARPKLLVVSTLVHPRSGSEPGIGYQWCRSLLRHFDVHLVSGRLCHDDLQGDPLRDQLTLHPTPLDPPRNETGWRFYMRYHAWCRHLPAFLNSVSHTINPIGLHHLNLGSFRVLPRYDRLGHPYTLGPIGGGEYAPLPILRRMEIPLAPKLIEALRRPINQTFTCLPALRAVVTHSRRALATSPESAAVLRRMGARDARITWPVALADRPSARSAAEARPHQRDTLRAGLRVVFGGRNAWWKGGTLAAQLVLKMRQAGIPATLDVYGEGSVSRRMQTMFIAAGMPDGIRLKGFRPYAEMLQALEQAHVFVLPSLHDSSGFALPEAYQHGLPAFTLGLGGHRTASCPAAGVNGCESGLDDWYRRCIDTARQWQNDPASWLSASTAARHHYETHLNESALDRTIDTHLVSAYL